MLNRAHAADVTAIVLTGTSVRASRAAITLAEPRTGLFATAGVHPHDAAEVKPGWAAELTCLARSADVVAIGEAGLDYYRNYSPRQEQRTVFRRQVELAVETGKPLFVHDRDSGGETRAILADYRADLCDCVIHCFTGTARDLDGYLDDGWHIGITGWVCDERRGQDLAGSRSANPGRQADDRNRRAVPPAAYDDPKAALPAQRALLPPLDRPARRRMPGADLRDIGRLTHANAARFFRLPEPFAP